ncbi:MAG: tetratricopeptide repeat protein, partial [Kiritimatiellaeota bacterium]|nr:tetratricopeptide repeat protein [Kiritimatiellota bacterium]
GRRGYNFLLVSGKLASLKSQIAAEGGDRVEALRQMQAARDAHLAAYALNPGAGALRDTVLELDFRLADREGAQKHAGEFLSRDRDHAFSHYILGALRLGEGKLEAAEAHLKHSVELKPEARFLNDYAETLRLLGKVDEAEKYARLAVESALREGAGRYACSAYDTLAMTLVMRGKYDEARVASDESLRFAEELYPENISLKLTRLHIATGLRAMDEARALRDEIAARAAELSPSEAEAFRRLSE